MLLLRSTEDRGVLDGWWEGRANPDGALGVGFEILLALNGTANLF